VNKIKRLRIAKRILTILSFILLIVVVLVGCIYWYRHSEIRVFRECHRVAEIEATKLLKDKYETLRKTSPGHSRLNEYRQALEEGRYVREDYVRHYDQCLKKRGLDVE